MRTKLLRHVVLPKSGLFRWSGSCDPRSTATLKWLSDVEKTPGTIFSTYLLTFTT